MNKKLNPNAQQFIPKSHPTLEEEKLNNDPTKDLMSPYMMTANILNGPNTKNLVIFEITVSLALYI